MLFLLALAFIASSTLVSNVTATSQSNTVQSHDKDINKRSDGLMHQLVNLLVDEKFHRKTHEMIDKMVQQNKQILEQFAGFSKQLKSFERNILKETSRGKILESEMKTLKKELGGTKKTMNKVIKNFNDTNIMKEMNKKTTLLSQQLESKVNTINYQITKLKNSVDIKHGAVYIRWGRTRCPSPDTKLVYSGYAAGAFYKSNPGTDTQCLPKNPNWRKYHDASNMAARIYGAEYQSQSYSVGEALHHDYKDYDVPCAVCQSTKRLNVHMIPAKDRCNSYGWHLEYRGYLMTQYHNEGGSNYVCVDAKPEKFGSKSDLPCRTFYPVETICGSLPCPPYVNHRELTCAVCTF